MSDHVTDLLPELAAGVLDAELRQQVESHLAECPACAAWLSELKVPAPESAPLARLELEKRVPSRRAAIHGFIDQRVGELGRFKGRFAELFCLKQEEAAQVLADAEHKAHWMPGPAEGIELFPVATPMERDMTVILRAKPWAVFPDHRHLGTEATLVLQGGFESGGQRYWRGDRLILPAGSAHRLTALKGAPCICAVRVQGEIEFL